jgi:hypothetical protein
MKPSAIFSLLFEKSQPFKVQTMVVVLCFPYFADISLCKKKPGEKQIAYKSPVVGSLVKYEKSPIVKGQKAAQNVGVKLTKLLPIG